VAFEEDFDHQEEEDGVGDDRQEDGDKHHRDPSKLDRIGLLSIVSIFSRSCCCKLKQVRYLLIFIAEAFVVVNSQAYESNSFDEDRNSNRGEEIDCDSTF
jgi:hypothetical protein